MIMFEALGAIAVLLVLFFFIVFDAEKGG